MEPEKMWTLNDEDFIDYLSVPDLQKAYTSSLKGLKEKAKKEFEENRDFFEKSKKAAIETDRRHRDLINSCIYPFTNNGSLAGTGYKYIRAAPLSELDVPNLDFLLFKHTDRFSIAVLGECKGSISNYKSIVRELQDRASVVEENLDYITKQYLKLSEFKRVFLEYVVAVPTNDALEMVNKIIENEGGLIVWQISITGDPEISIAFPAKGIPIPRETMMHKDPQLNRALDPLKHIQSNRNAFNVFPQGHVYTKLCSLIRSARPGDSGLVVSKEDLKKDISQDLFYMENNYIDKETDHILQKGIEIDFMEWIEADNIYKIKARGTKRKILEEQLEEKWIKNQLEQDLNKTVEDKKLLLRDEFIKKRGKVKTIFDF
jgi:hypothetical protein